MNGTPSTALATRNGTVATATPGALAIKPGQTDWDKFQAAALAQIGLRDAPNADRAVFLHMCQRTGLDPWSRQIHMIPRQEKLRDGTWTTKWTVQTGIDGWRVMRARAERDAGVRGILGRAVFYDDNGDEHKVWVRSAPPAACEITYTVRDRDGIETPYTSTLLFWEYAQLKDGEPVAQWKSKGAHMIEKCTEADVYRKAFPQDFSGIELSDAYSDDPDAPPVQPQRPRVTGDQARQRAQQVRAEVIDVQAADDVPLPDEPYREQAARQEQQPDGDPRDAVLASLERLGVTGAPAIASILTRLSGKTVASAESLTRQQAAWFAERLAGIETPDELEAAAVAAEEARSGE